jgi:hypothetical protein
MFDKHEVSGSIPEWPTNQKPRFHRGFFLATFRAPVRSRSKKLILRLILTGDKSIAERTLPDAPRMSGA